MAAREEGTPHSGFSNMSPPPTDFLWVERGICAFVGDFWMPGRCTHANWTRLQTDVLKRYRHTEKKAPTGAGHTPLQREQGQAAGPKSSQGLKSCLRPRSTSFCFGPVVKGWQPMGNFSLSPAPWATGMCGWAMTARGQREEAGCSRRAEH